MALFTFVSIPDVLRNPPNPNFLDNFLYNGTALYGQIVNTNNIHSYLGHKHPPDSISLRGSNYMSTMVVLVVEESPATRWVPYSNHCLSVRQKKRQHCLFPIKGPYIYLSTLIAQRLARLLCMRNVPGSNPTVGMNFLFCNSRFSLLAGLVSPCKWSQPWHTQS